MGERTAEPTGMVLIVDDEADLRALLDFNLRRAGWSTLQAETGLEAVKLARAARPRVVVLDLNLPDLPGTEVCRTLKSEAATRDVGVLMLTARGGEADRVTGFELGADDYVVKPFSVRELVLRVEALDRRLRAAGGPPPSRLRFGDVELDLDAVLVRVGGVEVPFTHVEFRLLAYLIEGEGRARSREELLANVWNVSPEVETRTVDTHVKRLREKLGPSGERIETVRGVGYRIR